MDAPRARRRRAAATCAALLAVLLWRAPARATSPTPDQPLLVTGEESAATVDGGAAMWLNPAGLGVRYPSELLIAWSRLGAKREINDEVWTAGGFGAFAERVRDTSQTYGFGLAGGGEPLRFGVTAVWHLDARTHEIAADHSLGLQSKPFPWLALGGAVDHLFQPLFRHDRLNRVYTLAAGLRPLALQPALAHGWGTRLTFTGDVRIPDDGAWRQSRTRVGAEFEVIPGLLLRGAAEDHRGVHFGVTLRGPRASFAAHRSALDGRRRDDSDVLSLHAGEERTAFASRADRRVATIRIRGDLGDESLGGFTLFGGVSTSAVGPLHQALERALQDPLTRGVLLELDDSSNLAQLEELAPRIAALRRAGKPVLAYLEEGGSRGDLYLAALCDRVVAGPEADFAALGLRVERRYYRHLLADWGARVDRTSHGRYKSAYREFSADSTPAADREDLNRRLDVTEALLVDTLVTGRHTTRERVLPVLDGRSWRTPDLQAAGLVDSSGYREDALRILGHMCGLGDRPRTVAPRGLAVAKRGWTVPTRVAVVYASGGIESGWSGNDLLLGPTMGSSTLVRQLDRAFHRPDVRAVVLRVESPGGSAIASDLIHHATQRLQRETRKPLVISMGSVAASGGYYISAAGARIYADRATRTGSIGVLSYKLSFEDWYRRHDVHEDDFERGGHMNQWSAAHDWRPADQASADSSTRRYYDAFVQHVADGRRLSFAAVDSAAQGRVWMGEDARAHHLVDAIGGLADAITEARRLGHVPTGEDIRIAEYRRPRPGFVQRLIGGAIAQAWAREVQVPAPGEALLWDDEAP